MGDFIEVDFLGVETKTSGDAITLRYSIAGVESIHVVDGGYIDTGVQIIEHLQEQYGTVVIDHVVLTHSDRDHANGLRRVLEDCKVGTLWMNRPWLYADELIHRFESYESVDALRRKLREVYAGPAELEDIAVRKRIPIKEAFQGNMIGECLVLAPTMSRYLDLVAESSKTPQHTESRAVSILSEFLGKMVEESRSMVSAAWGEEFFPASGTSAENEMSVVQTLVVNGRRLLLTGDTGRDGLAEAADYLEGQGGQLPGVWAFQVPHHGGRHNVSTKILDRWLGPRLNSPAQSPTWKAVCSSAKEDAAHPRKSVVRAMIHRGGHFAETEGRTMSVSNGISRPGWSAVPQASYPTEQEED